MLTCDSGKVRFSCFERFGIGNSFAQADIQNNFFQTRNLHSIFITHALN